MTSIASFFRPDTFWALCNRCNVQYEYTNIFLNQTILCYRCHQPFLATAVPVQSRSSCPSPFPNEHQQDMHAAAQPSASRTSQAPSSHTSKKHAKRRRKDGQKCDDYNDGSQGEILNMKKACADAKGKFVAKQPRSTRVLSHRNMRAMLIGKAKTGIRHQLNDWQKEKMTSSLSNGQHTGNVVHASCNNSRHKK